MKEPSTTLLLLIAILLLVAWRTGKLVRILNLAFQR